MSVIVVDHPVVTHKMNILRDKNTRPQMFRNVVNELTMLLSYEATRRLPVQSTTIETPLTTMETNTLEGDPFVIVPILRAGLGMVAGMHHIFPDAVVAHIGLKRDEETALPMTYYQNLPASLGGSTAIVVDPMLATGGSLSAGIDLVKDATPAPRQIIAICLIAAPEGKERIEKDHPNVDVFVAALDEKLNEKAFIVPGLGDAGDRIFGTV